MTSPRLTYAPVSLAAVDEFHALVVDEHVRRYLMDGNIFPIEWTRDRIRDSEGLFHRRAVGLWLAHEIAARELVGFCGFLELPDVHPEPQLVYALFERFAGRGYATEMARASIAEARRHGFAEIVAGVDEVNAVSAHLLEKLGFERTATLQGAFGNMFVCRLAAPRN